MTSVEPAARTIVVTGAHGQLGRELLSSAPLGWRVLGYSRHELDITDGESVRAALDAARPAIVINAAAYTAVDRAEEAADVAHAVNADGAGRLAAAARAVDARFVHISTDFVFDGARPCAYLPDAPPSPLNAYGRSKAEGERQVLRLGGDAATIVRTGWLYSVHGTNFVKTMLQLMSTRGRVTVVADQIGSPTWAGSCASALWLVALRHDMPGIWHWSDAGVASWYDFAVAIADEGMRQGLLPARAEVVPIATHEYPALARRPVFSVLDSSRTYAHLQVPMRHWSQSLRAMLVGLAGAASAIGAAEIAR